MNRLPAFTLDLDFPFPPALDQYWPEIGGRMHLGLEGRRYRERVASILAQYSGPPLEGRLSGHITFHPPNRQRDLDNAIVVMLDALSHGGAFESDDQICDLDVRRGPVVPGGRVVVLAEGAA
jgi:crossover junction endodeoxyribonuclease RusA